MEEKLRDAEKIVEDMEKETKLSKLVELIKDNKISFEHEGKKYRVRLLNLKEKDELDFLKRKKFGQLMKDKDILMEKDLIAQYKERGIDIGELDEQIRKLGAEDLDLTVKLGEALSKKSGDTILNNYRNQIEEIKKKIKVLKTQRTLLTKFCLEDTLLDYVAQVVTFLSLEVLSEEGSWERKFKTLEEFQTYPDEKLINIAGVYSMAMQYIL